MNGKFLRMNCGCFLECILQLLGSKYRSEFDEWIRPKCEDVRVNSRNELIWTKIWPQNTSEFGKRVNSSKMWGCTTQFKFTYATPYHRILHTRCWIREVAKALPVYRPINTFVYRSKQGPHPSKRTFGTNGFSVVRSYRTSFQMPETEVQRNQLQKPCPCTGQSILFFTDIKTGTASIETNLRDQQVQCCSVLPKAIKCHRLKCSAIRFKYRASRIPGTTFVCCLS